MGSGFSKMKKQAKLFEQQLESARTNLKAKTVTGISGNGLVTVLLNGEKKLQQITIKPECLTDVEGLQDLIKAALENGYQQLQTDDTLPAGFSLDPFLN